MKLSKKSEYACLALLYMAENYGKSRVTIAKISKEKCIPKKFLEQILVQLKYMGLVKSERGPKGGYFLKKRPEKISLAEIIRGFEGYLAPIKSVSENDFDHTPTEKHEKLLNLMKEIRDYVADKLENTTIADLL